MQAPFFKKILSYLTEIHLESAPSEINPHLYVSLNKGRYQLSTANAVYSYGDLYDNFSKTFDQLEPELTEKMNVLILGFGLGSIPYMLENTFGKQMYYTAVEIDENVIYLAEKYVLDELDAPIQLICMDAFAFVMQCQEQFDLICMDVFLDDVVPPKFTGKHFLEALKDLLEPDGRLLFNRLALSNEDLERTGRFYEKEFKPVFEDGTYLDVGGNWMLMNRGV
ncbi:MAG: SAM-dependent methyltransferase [Paraglaciecola sp.]|jgi:SAM-dependent methyltransferase